LLHYCTVFIPGPSEFTALYWIGVFDTAGL